MKKFIMNRIDSYIYRKNKKLKKKMEKLNKLDVWFNYVVKASKYKQVAFKNRIKMYLHGFSSDQYENYNLKDNDYKNYITDYERYKSREVNGEYNIILDDKRLFYEVFSKYVNIPKTLVYITDGKITDYDTDDILSVEDIMEMLKDKNGLVFRPLKSGGGKGINVIKYKEGIYYLNGDKVTQGQAQEVIEGYENCIITEFLNQHKYSNDIYDKSVNTIRIVSIYTKEKGAEIILAVHRFGTSTSCPVDNICSGGIFSSIDIKSGTLSSARSYRNNDKVKNHPDTNSQIEGVVIPKWNEIKEKIIDIANKFPYINFIAWDVAVTDDGFSVIEGNASTGLPIFQIFGPLRDEKLGEFYKKMGIIKN